MRPATKPFIIEMSAPGAIKKRDYFRQVTAPGWRVLSVQPDMEDAASAREPAFTAALRSKSSCQFELAATWAHAADVAKVEAIWYFNGTPPAPDGTWAFTMQAPGTGPNAGTIEGHHARFTAGPLYPSSASYPWYVLVQYYDAAGTQLASIYSNVDTTACANQPGL